MWRFGAAVMRFTRGVRERLEGGGGREMTNEKCQSSNDKKSRKKVKAEAKVE